MSRPDINLGIRPPGVALPELQPVPRESEVYKAVKKYEVPLLSRAWELWSDQDLSNGKKRGWLICGPATTAFSRVANHEAKVPILKDGNPFTQEFLQIQTVFYRPESGAPEDSFEHALMLHFNQERVTVYDITGQLSFGEKTHLTGADDLSGAIKVSTYPVSDYKEALQREHRYFPFDPADPLVEESYRRRGHSVENATWWADWFAIQNDDRMTDSYPWIGDSGQEITVDRHPDRYGPQLASLIREFLPDWKGIIPK